MTTGLRMPRPAGGATWSKKQPQSSYVMKIAVVGQSGPLMIDETTCPIQLSPAIIEVPLCCEVPPVAPSGSRIEKAGRFPADASVTIWLGGTMLRDCAV